MRRRTLLGSAAAALGTGLAGCLSRAAPGISDGTTSANETDSTGAANAPAAVRVRVAVANRSDAARDVTATVAHVATPACRYATPECGRPTTERVALNESFTLTAGSQRVLPWVEMAIEDDGNVVDAYEVSVAAAGASGRLHGLEPGAASVVGRDAASDYPWRAAAGDYVIHAALLPDGVNVTLRSGGASDENRTPPGNPCIRNPGGCGVRDAGT